MGALSVTAVSPILLGRDFIIFDISGLYKSLKTED